MIQTVPTPPRGRVARAPGRRASLAAPVLPARVLSAKVLPFALALALGGPRAAAAEESAAAIAWLPSFDEARQVAEAESRPLLIAVNMDGEKANDGMAEVVYRDPRIVELIGHVAPVFASRFDHGSGAAPCPRSGAVTCDQHRAIEKAVRRELETDDRGEVIAPQHVLRSPAGEEILRVPYRISQPELEWCLVTAIRTVDPDFRWELPEGAQPPKRLVMEGVALGPASPGDPPPDHAEVEELIKTIRAVKKPWTRVEDVRRLMLSPEKKAVEYIGDLLTLLPDKADKLLTRHLGDLGRLAPPEYRKVVEEYLDADLAEVRIAAAVALEQIADPKATKALTRQWKRERDVAVRRELIHAIARCAGDDRAAVKLVSTAAADSDEPDVQVSAVLAAADLSDAAAASEIVRTALASRDPGARRAGAWVAGHVGGGALKDALLEARSVEEDPEARAAMDLACDVLEGAAAQQKLEKLRRDLEPDALDRVR